MVVRDVGENSSGQLGACEAVLVDAVGTRFHENVLATGVRHATEQLLHLQGVGRGVAGRDNFVEYAVFNRRKHPGSAVHGTEQAVEQADRCRFPVGSRDRDHLHRGTRVVVKLRSDVAQCNPRVHDPDIGDVLGALLGQALADNRRCALGGRLFDEVMSVNAHARNGDKQTEGLHLAAVKRQVLNGHVGVAQDVLDARAVEDFFQEFHAFKTIRW